MNSYVVESLFEHYGLPCVVVMRVPGYRCGYVGVPKGHCLYGVDYHDHLEIKKDDLRNREVDSVFSLFSACLDDDPRIRADAYFRCHGGLTYSDGGEGSEYPVKSDYWWFGFDCSHAGDRNDYQTAKRLFADNEKHLQRIAFNERIDEDYLQPGSSDYEVRSLEYAEDECRKLAEQLASFRPTYDGLRRFSARYTVFVRYRRGKWYRR